MVGQASQLPQIDLDGLGVPSWTAQDGLGLGRDLDHPSSVQLTQAAAGEAESAPQQAVKPDPEENRHRDR